MTILREKRNHILVAGCIILATALMFFYQQVESYSISTPDVTYIMAPKHLDCEHASGVDQSLLLLPQPSASAVFYDGYPSAIETVSEAHYLD